MLKSQSIGTQIKQYFKAIILETNIAMLVNGWVLSIIAIGTLIIVGFLIWKNLKDENEVIKSFNEESKPEKHDQQDDLNV